MTNSPQVPAKSLPALLYLLGIDLDKEKVPDRKKLGYVMRAGALIDLVLRGKLADVGGRARVTSEHGTGDRVLDKLLDEIANDRERKWKYLVRRHDRDTLAAVEDQLVSAGAITVRKRLLLARRVAVSKPAAVGEIKLRVHTVLTGGVRIEQLDRFDVALTALAANGELATVISNKQSRAHRDRVIALTDHIGTSAPALKRLVAELNAARSARGALAAANAR